MLVAAFTIGLGDARDQTYLVDKGDDWRIK